MHTESWAEMLGKQRRAIEAAQATLQRIVTGANRVLTLGTDDEVKAAMYIVKELAEKTLREMQ